MKEAEMIAVVAVFITSVVSGVALRASNRHHVSDKALDGGVTRPDSGVACSNFCPLPPKQVEFLRKENERLDHDKVIVRRLIRHRVWEERLRERLVEVVASTSHFEKVDPLLTLSIIRVESNFVPNVTSGVGAMGLMQLMPETARAVGTKHPYNVEENVRGGVRYLGQLQVSFGTDTKKIVAAYNAGPRAVRYFRGVPPFEETREYVKKVTAEHRRLERERQRFEEMRADL